MSVCITGSSQNKNHETKTHPQPRARIKLRAACCAPLPANVVVLIVAEHSLVLKIIRHLI
jgi:hypothetical protein